MAIATRTADNYVKATEALNSLIGLDKKLRDLIRNLYRKLRAEQEIWKDLKPKFATAKPGMLFANFKVKQSEYEDKNTLLDLEEFLCRSIAITVRKEEGNLQFIDGFQEFQTSHDLIKSRNEILLNTIIIFTSQTRTIQTALGVNKITTKLKEIPILRIDEEKNIIVAEENLKRSPEIRRAYTLIQVNKFLKKQLEESITFKGSLTIAEKKAKAQLQSFAA